MIYDIDIDIDTDIDIDIHINRHLGLQKWGGDTINGYKQTWHWMCYIYINTVNICILYPHTSFLSREVA